MLLESVSVGLYDRFICNWKPGSSLKLAIMGFYLLASLPEIKK
jgi:hypothetical protein